MREIAFTAETDGQRLDVWLASRFPDLSRTQIQRLITSGAVRVNGEPRKPASRVEVGDHLAITLPEQQEPPILPEPIPLDVLYEDAHLLVVNKPAGLVVHPAAGHTSGTLVNALLAHCPQVAEVGGRERAGIVHRLDKETSGLLVVAKDTATHAALQRQFKLRQVQKTYLALVEGRVSPREGLIEVPIGRDPRDRKRMAAQQDGRPALTRYRMVEAFREHTLLEVQPHTGRTHQVRVHLAWLGYPVVGDRVYGHRRQQLLSGRHFLHAAELRFKHPATGEEMTFTAPLPSELSGVLERLRAEMG